MAKINKTDDSLPSMGIDYHKYSSNLRFEIFKDSKNRIQTFFCPINILIFICLPYRNFQFFLYLVPMSCSLTPCHWQVIASKLEILLLSTYWITFVASPFGESFLYPVPEQLTGTDQLEERERLCPLSSSKSSCVNNEQ
ncbi:hypothetical protein BDF20DRAFT_831002 [Mycotypha africana]|uniref:uncharacterized protein n=1 Tax=Mycotypha africana TaxID=64632 RepID=UPI0023003592|nr:uncharacterized protein BDF20DRAFT_831002 [Mycotypha africana]KAI8990913.1 hypothetical protein BDF20DRAFT_831002 [Mycotypha africana]